MNGRRQLRVWLLLSAACLVPAVLDGVQFSLQGYVAGGQGPSWRAVVWQSSEWIILGMLTPLTYVLGRRFPFRQPHPGRSIAAHLGGAAMLTVLWATLGMSLRWALGTQYRSGTFSVQLASWMLTTIPWALFMYFAVLGCVHAFTYFVEAREREAQTARLSAQLAEARLGALRMQLNPHFLFNSLNAVTVLVRDQETRAATQMLELLSDVLRQVLRSDQTPEIQLREELQFIERYLAIEQVRYSDRLRVSMQIDPSVLDAAVPGLILQPLVENAIRHGLARQTRSGSLEIGARRETRGDQVDVVLWVRDDGVGLSEPDGGERREGVGLRNTRERLHTLYGDRASLTLAPVPEGGVVASIRLPWRAHERIENVSGGPGPGTGGVANDA